MQEDFSRYTLIQFINNYTQAFLQRTLRSNNSRRFVQKFKSKINCKTKNVQNVCIPELTTETFLNTILDSTKVNWKEKDKFIMKLKNNIVN